MASVLFENIHRHYAGLSEDTVKGIDLAIEDGEFMVLVGPSGCGKSTTLRMLAGLEPVDEGRILIGDRDVTHAEPKDRDVAMVFQNYALYPHMSVAENMGFALKMAGVDKAERDRRVGDAAAMLGLTELLDRKPKSLSGGQRQRVAMGRAIVRQPLVFCMDEPLSNLDAKMRVQTRTDIAKLQASLGITTVYVTHDQVEAMTMGHRVAVMNAGILQQVDTPLALYSHPANLFVAGFIGSPQMNLIEARVEAGRAAVGEFLVPLTLPGEVPERITVGVRPEAWQLTSAGAHALAVSVDVVEELGSDSYVYGTARGLSGEIPVIVRVGPKEKIGSGEVVHVTVDPGDVHAFDTATGLRLRD